MMGNLPPVKRAKRETTFEHLPDEIVHNIFQILDKNSLKNSALINKR